MKHSWIACWLTADLEGWHCSVCGDEIIEPEGLDFECKGNAGVEKVSEFKPYITFDELKESLKYRDNWFDNLFSGEGLCGYRPTHAITHPHKMLGYAFDQLKYAYQRVFWGYDERVVWSIDHHITKYMPIWLNKLKNNKYGIPSSFFSNPEDSTKEDRENARLLWDNELQIMIDGFEASEEIQNSSYYDGEEYEKLMGIFEKGMKSFTKYYFSLWD